MTDVLRVSVYKILGLLVSFFVCLYTNNLRRACSEGLEYYYYYYVSLIGGWRSSPAKLKSIHVVI